MNGALFSRRLIVAWIGAALVTFAVSLYFMGGGGPKGVRDAVGPSTFSRSAIGYAGIAEILRRLDIPVVKSRSESLARLARGGVLVIAEPSPLSASAETLDALLQAKQLLLILPKWHGEESGSHAGWLGNAELLPEMVPRWALGRAVPEAELLRQDATPEWTVNRLGPSPSPDAPVQLVKSDRLRPVVGTADAMLVGELEEKGRRLWVLSDPDVIDNHGLARDGNAAFAVALLDAIRGNGKAAGSVVFDETVHGYVARAASPARLLFEFPFVLATAQAVLAVLLLLWATLGRFGAPEAAPPPLEAGKAGLIRNGAALLDHAGHQPVIVRRYVQGLLREAARELRAPRGLEGRGLADWLRQLGEARRVTIDCAAVAAEAERRGDAAGLAAAARAIHQWKGEILDGAAGDSHPHGRAEERGAQGRRRAG